MGSWGHRCGILRRAGAAVGAGTAPGEWRPQPVRNPATGALEWHQSITAAGGGREAVSFEELQLAARGAGGPAMVGQFSTVFNKNEVLSAPYQTIWLFHRVQAPSTAHRIICIMNRSEVQHTTIFICFLP